MRYPQDGDHPGPIAKAIYMCMRVTGFESPTQNEMRKVGGGGGGAPPMDAPFHPDMHMGGEPGFGSYGPAAGNGMGNKRFNPYSSPPARGGGDDGVCGVHNRRRGRQNLQPHPHNARMMVCLDTDACKGSAAAEAASRVCFTHGKRRGEQNLQPHPSQANTFVCMECDQCK